MTQALFGAVCLTHLPYLVWITSGPGVTALRSLAALGALLVLLYSHRVRPARASRVPWRVGAAALVVSMGFALLGMLWPPLWMVSLPLGVTGWLLLRGGGVLVVRASLLVVLAALVFPFDRSWADLLDPILQAGTAAASAPLIRGTGLQVVLEAAPDPVLVADNLRVTVTSLCAGTQTLLSMVTLGALVGHGFVPSARGRLLFFGLTPLVGLMGNVVRVVLSTHAARQWAWDPVRWQIAHDGIGYGVFALTYLVLLLLVRRLRRPAVD